MAKKFKRKESDIKKIKELKKGCGYCFIVERCVGKATLMKIRDSVTMAFPYIKCMVTNTQDVMVTGREGQLELIKEFETMVKECCGKGIATEFILTTGIPELRRRFLLEEE